MTTIRTKLNEVFVRLTDAGDAIQGVHAADRTAILDDAGNEVKSWFEPPRAVDPADSAALGPLFEPLNLAALKSVDDLTQQLAAMTTDRDAALAAKAQAEADRDAALAQVAQLQAQLAQPAPALRFIKKWQLSAGLRKDDPSGALLSAFTSVINGLPAAVKELWDGSSGVEEDSPFLTLAKAAPMSLTDAQISSMFDRYPKITQADVLAMVQG